MSVLANLVNSVDEIPTEILVSDFLNNEKLILKFTKNDEGPRTAPTPLKKDRDMGGMTPRDFETCWEAVVINTAWYGQYNRNTVT